MTQSLSPKVSEAAFLKQVISLARVYRYRVCHFRPAMNRRGNWQTAIEGDPGWPDLILARPGRVIVAELKSARGRVSLDQWEWIRALNQNLETYVWRPADLPEIARILSPPQPERSPK